MKAPNIRSGLAHRLILYASQKAPAVLCERLKEEWLADLEYRSGPFAQLRLAIGCCWATTIIARDFDTAQLATSRVLAAHWTQLRSIAEARMPPLSRTVVIAILAGVGIAGYAYSKHPCTSEATLHHASSALEINPKSAAVPTMLNTEQKPIGSSIGSHD
jgi:hypothetical protein